MRKTSLFLSLCLYSAATAQPLPDHYARSYFLFAPSTSYDEGLVGFANPANLAMLHRPEMRLNWSTDGSDALSFNNWGFFSGIHGLGFAMQRQKFNDEGVTDFRLSTGFGTRGSALGLAYGWSSRSEGPLGREKLISVGSITRPNRYLSFGMLTNLSVESSAREGVAELGWRPFGTAKLTLFADAALQKGTKFKDAPWSAGGAVQLASGIALTGRYFRSEAFTLGININFGMSGLASQVHFDENSNRALHSYQLRTGGMKTSIFQTKLRRGKAFTSMPLKGSVDYLDYEIFGGAMPRFYPLLRDIRGAIDDPRISAIAINLSGFSARPEHAWEIREALRAAKGAGKRIIAFIDQNGMTGYHIASIADLIVMDPQGQLVLPGYSLSQTYFKGTLEKLGLGFEEWRFFKYKSANEIFSQESMSEADREQNQAFLDDWYETTRSDVATERGLTEAEFDRIIDDEGFLLAEQALELNLVDTLARWSEVDNLVARATGGSKDKVDRGQLLPNATNPERWGDKRKIAIVYGLGVCEMDSGIRARWLQGVFERLSKNRSVEAVVFRVDSPGGDGMASDVVAEALRKCSEEKPVIISQGQVAASGGYWISMYGDEILAGPNTITGSIGVISGWVWDKEFGEKLGMTSDVVTRGKHADLYSGIRLPPFNLQIPARSVTDEERQIVERTIRQLYDDFIKKVAASRDIPEERVREIAEGRIYSGLDGLDIDLVDRIGGLWDAIGVAKVRAGLDAEEEIEIIEIPKSKGLLNLRSQVLPVRANSPLKKETEMIEFFLKHKGRAIPMLSPGYTLEPQE
jgi:protease-4